MDPAPPAPPTPATSRRPAGKAARRPQVLDPAIQEFLPTTTELLDRPPSPITRIYRWTLVTLLFAVVVWSTFGVVDVDATATGKIQPSGRSKVVQPVDSGMVSAIHVRNNEHVTEGQILIELDPTDALATLATTVASLNTARAEAARRKVAIAAVQADTLVPAPAIPWDDAIPQQYRGREEEDLKEELSQLAATLVSLKAQRQEKEVERDQTAASIAAEDKLAHLLAEPVSMRKAMVVKDANSRAYLIESEQALQQVQTTLVGLHGTYAETVAALAVIDSTIASTRQNVITSNAQTLDTVARQIDSLVQQEIIATAHVEYTKIRAPIAGAVQELVVTSLGQVIAAGQNMMQIIPVGLPLEIEAYVLNSNIGFIKKNQDVAIKIDAFPFTQYGTIPGTISTIANDAVSQIELQQSQSSKTNNTSTSTSQIQSNTLSVVTAAEQVGDLVFPIIVTSPVNAINVDNKTIPLSSGMTVTVDIMTERRRVIDFLLEPLVEIVQTALRER